MAVPVSALSTDPAAVAVRSLQAMDTGGLAEFDLLYHPAAVDRENAIQPPASRVPGPAGVHATAVWLRAAFTDLKHEIQHTLAQADLVAVAAIMHGRHTGPIAFYAPDGSVDSVFPPTGKAFSITQSHWFQVRDGRIVEHWANRDDMGMARQLGWIPPTPGYLFKMGRAKRRATRS
jgi:predicted ester cyclase